MLRKNHGYSFLLFAFLVSAFFIPDVLQAACSPYHERATINEIHDQGVVEYFVEVKPLDNTIQASIYNNWTVTICNDSGTCVGPLPLSLANQNNYPWLVLGKESVSDPDDPIGDPNLIDVSQGMDVILQDGNGDTIDYVTLNGYTAQQDASCTPAYDWQVTITQSNTNTVQRIPDGTGTWTGAPGGSNPPTDTTTNDPLPDGSTPPSLSLSHVIVSSGQTANFILTLEADAAYDITVDYQTLDDTALAGTHYTATSGTITIPAGTTAGYTVTIPVVTLLPAPATDVGFYLFLDNPVNVALPSQFAIGTITSSVLLLDTRLDECAWAPASLDVIDSSGNNQHSTAVNGPIPVDISEESGGICMGAAFDGVDDYIELPPAFPNLQGSFTFSAWIRADNLGGDQRIFADDQNNSGGFAFSLNDGGNGRLRFFSRNVTPIILDSGVVIQESQWHFVTAVHDASSKTRRIYVDGNMVASDTYTGSWGVDNGVAAIGGEPDGSSESTSQWRFEGVIDEVLVFGSAVSDSMINIIYTNQLAKKNFEGSSRTCTACGPPADTFVLSTDGNAELVSPSLTFDNNDAVEYSASTSTATLLYDIGALFSSGANLVNALHLHPDGHVYFSLSEDSTTTASYGSQSYDSDDILDYDPVNDTLTLLFDGDSHFSANDENIDALYIDDADDLYISTTDGATIGGQGMNDEDVVRYTVATSTASLYFDGSTHFSNNEDVDGFHIIDANTVLLSTTGNATLGAFFWWGGLTFTDGDVVKYDTATNTPTLFFDETTEFVDNEEIDAISIRPPLAPVVDHYIINHAGTGITCEAELVTISAHDANHVPVSPGTTITISTSPAGDSWALQSGTPANFSNLGSGQAEYTFAAGESSVSLWLTRLTAATIDIDITDGTGITEASGTVLPGNDPSLDFRDTGFRFYAGGVANTIGPQIAGKESNINPGSQTLTIRAVQTNTDTGACEGRLSGPQTIEMAFECTDPTTCQAVSDVNITGINLLGAPIGTSPIAGNPLAVVATYSNIDLEFNASGIATFTMNYEDAGQIALHAKEDIAAVPPDPAITLLGNSNTFTVVPAGLCVESPDANSDCTAIDRDGDLDVDDFDYALCSIFKKAGQSFNLTVRAVAWQTAGESNDDFCTGNATTPNFQLTNIVISNDVIAPSGGSDGSIGTTSFDMAPADNGEHTMSQSVSEVGVFTFTATAPAYFGETIAASTSANIGRFTPDHFTLAVANTGSFDNTGTNPTFTYLGEPFGYTSGDEPQFTITAENTGNTTTANYTGAFNKIDLGEINLTYPTSDTSQSDEGGSPINLTSTPGTHLLTDNNGTITLTLGGTTADSFSYARNLGLVAPFNPDLTISLESITETEDTVSDITASLPVSPSGFSVEQRFGRAVLQNTFGPETENQLMPLVLQYYDGTTFQSNDLDINTTFASLLPGGPSALNCIDNILPPTDTLECAEVSCVDNDVRHNDTFPLTSPGLGNTGTLDYTLTVPTWLQFDWDSDTNHDNNPTTSATFGIYRGNDRIINWREIVR